MDKQLEREVSEKLGWSTQQIALSRNKDMLLALSQHTPATSSFEQPSVCVRRKVFVSSPKKPSPVREVVIKHEGVKQEEVKQVKQEEVKHEQVKQVNKIDVQRVLLSGTDAEMLQMCTRLSVSLKTLRQKKAHLESVREQDSNVILFDAAMEQVNGKIDKRMHIACRILEHLDARIKHMVALRSVLDTDDDEYVLHDVDTAQDSTSTEQQIDTRMSAMRSCVDVLRA